MAGTLDYEGPVNFQVIKIQNKTDETDERKKADVKRNFKHKVKYDDSEYPDEWLLLDLKKNTYTAFDGKMYTKKILEVI